MDREEAYIYQIHAAAKKFVVALKDEVRPRGPLSLSQRTASPSSCVLCFHL